MLPKLAHCQTVFKKPTVTYSWQILDLNITEGSTFEVMEVPKGRNGLASMHTLKWKRGVTVKVWSYLGKIFNTFNLENTGS